MGNRCRDTSRGVCNRLPGLFRLRTRGFTKVQLAWTPEWPPGTPGAKFFPGTDQEPGKNCRPFVPFSAFILLHTVFPGNPPGRGQLHPSVSLLPFLLPSAGVGGKGEGKTLRICRARKLHYDRKIQPHKRFPFPGEGAHHRNFLTGDIRPTRAEDQHSRTYKN